MAETSWPFGEDALPEDGWSKMARLFESTGVVGDPGGAAVQVYADSSGMQVFVRTGAAFVRGHYYQNDATKTVSIPSNGAGSARFDRIVLRLDPTADTITAIRVAGTAGSAAPALTQTDTGNYDLPLAQVRVEPGAVNIAAGKVTDERLYSGLYLIPARAVGDVASPRIGQMVHETTTGRTRKWNGSDWVTMIDEVGTFTQPTSHTSGDSVFASMPAKIAAGSIVAVTDSGGRIAVGMPPGWTKILACVAVNGDFDSTLAGAAYSFAVSSDAPARGVFRVTNSSGVVLAGVLVRVNFIAVGY